MTTKKIGASTIALIVVSVLLIMSLTVTATLAWFMDSDSANSPDIMMGERVEVTIDRTTRSDLTGGGAPGKTGENFDIIMFAEELVPGMKVAPNLRVYIMPSSTTVVLRVQLTVSVTPGSGNPDAGDVTQLEADIIAGINAMLGSDWFYYDFNTGDDEPGWYYYLGTEGSASTYVMTRTAEGVGGSGGTKLVDGYDAEFVNPTNRKTTAGASTVMGTIDSSDADEGGLPVYFFNPGNQFFRIPHTLTNEFAGSQITLKFDAEIIQDFLLDNNAGTENPTFTVLPTITEVNRILGD